MDPRIRAELWQPYVQDIARACLAQEPHEDNALVVAIWARETHIGTCPGYAPKGPNGRGDGGHGRGLGQIDDRGPWKHLIPPDGTDWTPFEQAMATCTVLSGARQELADFRGALSPRAWDETVVCRYNAALVNVRWAITNGRDPNLVTTGRDYGRDVLALRDKLRAAFPATFPRPAAPAGDVA
jgi:hypothetical protein